MGEQAWRPIETAPRDGTKVLLYCPTRGVVGGRWSDNRYAKTPRPYWSNDLERLYGVQATRFDQPTHWLPLPDPPTPDPQEDA